MAISDNIINTLITRFSGYNYNDIKNEPYSFMPYNIGKNIYRNLDVQKLYMEVALLHHGIWE